MTAYVGLERHGSPDQWDELLAKLAECDRIEREQFSASISMVEDVRQALEEAAQ